MKPSIFHRVWAPVLRVICRATGCDNFQVFRVAGLVSLALDLFWAIRWGFIFGGLVYNVVGEAFWLSMVAMVYMRVRRFEESVNRGAPHIDVWVDSAARAFRLWWTITACFTLLPPYRGLAPDVTRLAAYLLGALAAHAVLDVTPRTRGPIRRLVGWVKAFRLPSFAPSPTWAPG